MSGGEGDNRENELAGWHHQLNGHGFLLTLGVGDGLGGLACCSSRGHGESYMSGQLNWNWNIN